jgi:hypothetical protein
MTSGGDNSGQFIDEVLDISFARYEPVRLQLNERSNGVTRYGFKLCKKVLIANKGDRSRSPSSNNYNLISTTQKINPKLLKNGAR